MATSRELEAQISSVERLEVRLVNENGRRVRADAEGFADYPYQNAANRNLTVAAWKEARFAQHYDGYEIDVINANGESARGNTLLTNLRRNAVRQQPQQIERNEADDDLGPLEDEWEEDPPAIINYPDLAIRRGTALPTIEIDTDHLPYPGAFEDAVYESVRAWVRDHQLDGPATIWKWGTISCDFIEHGQVWAVFVIPFGFGAGFFQYLHRELSARLRHVRFGDYIAPSENNGWNAICHVQGGRVYQVLDAASWQEVR